MQGMLDSAWAAQSIGLGERLRCKMMVSTVQEGHWTIIVTIVEKRTKARGPGHLQGTRKTNCIPAVAYNIEEWMWGLEEDASKVEMRNDEVSNHGTGQKKAHSQHVGRGRRWHRRQGTPWLLRNTSGGSPSSGEGVQIREANGVPISWPWWEGLGRATGQEGQEEVWGWRSICWSSRMKRPRMLWLTLPGDGT